MPHSFSVGDVVTYLDPTLNIAFTCNITRVMPVERYGRYYRIHNAAEAFDRSVPDHMLSRIASTSESQASAPPGDHPREPGS